MKQEGKVKEVEKMWLSVRESQSYLDCSKDYLYRLLDEGKIQAAKDGKMTFFLKSSIDSYLQRLIVIA